MYSGVCWLVADADNLERNNGDRNLLSRDLRQIRGTGGSDCDQLI
jgi:hypothetical protein